MPVYNEATVRILRKLRVNASPEAFLPEDNATIINELETNKEEQYIREVSMKTTG